MVDVELNIAVVDENSVLPDMDFTAEIEADADGNYESVTVSGKGPTACSFQAIEALRRALTEVLDELFQYDHAAKISLQLEIDKSLRRQREADEDSTAQLQAMAREMAG